MNYEKTDVNFRTKVVSLVNQTYLNMSLKYDFGNTLGSGDTACNVLVCAETCVLCAFVITTILRCVSNGVWLVCV